jgi:TolB protein
MDQNFFFDGTLQRRSRIHGNLQNPARSLARALLLVLGMSLTSCGGHTSNNANSRAGTIAFVSSGALDGSLAANAANNIWLMNSDGSNRAPLTRITSFGADNVEQSWSPDGSKLAFTSSRALDGSNSTNKNRTHNVWVMNADGSGAVPLTKMQAVGAECVSPAWSPDGRKLLFDSGRALDGSDASGTGSNIWVMNADGSNAVPLTRLTASNNQRPVWSPDGSRVAFDSSRALDGSDNLNLNQTFNIWVMNADGSGAFPLTRLTAAPSAGSLVARWSPDSRKVAFESGRALDGSNNSNPNGVNVWVVNADGSAATPLTRLNASHAGAAGAAWSPDGTQLAFASSGALDVSNSGNGSTNIWVMRADGSSAKPLTKFNSSGLGADSAAWAPDGSKLAYVCNCDLAGNNAPNANSVANIWAINADGTGAGPLTRQTTFGTDSASPQWHP